MDRTLRKLDSIVRSGPGSFSPITSSAMDGIGYNFTVSDMRATPGLDFDRDVRDRKKFDDDDELCTCVDPCDEINQVDNRDYMYGDTVYGLISM